MKWVNFLHLYQPMNADAATIREATEKSYYRIVRALEEHPNIKFTLNINGCLLMRWDELGLSDIIARVDKLVKQSKVELTGTAAYHPLLPLVPTEEVKRQIKENETIIKKYFGNYKPRGFFLPEMAYSPAVAKIVSGFGYEWIILDEIAYNGKLNQVDFKKIYLDKNSGLKIIFRERQLSQSFIPDALKKEKDANALHITATDGELYGLRHIDHTGEFEKLLSDKNLETELISEFIENREARETIKPASCNWESTAAELNSKNPYALWHDKNNKIQQSIWQLANLAYSTAEKFKLDKNYLGARWHLARGLASCTWWWASGKNLGHFSPVAWNPDEVERGLNELIRAVRTLDDKKTRNIKIKAEKLCLQIREELWTEHWSRFWKK